ncbi:hypothetical protein L218DRAFT_943759 [Marasmius fiardii PR-910]|nr:hypothetical protein L218DRAFT_943759 [Marasmius fiardii PR-910]
MFHKSSSMTYGSSRNSNLEEGCNHGDTNTLDWKAFEEKATRFPEQSQGPARSWVKCESSHVRSLYEESISHCCIPGESMATIEIVAKERKHFPCFKGLRTLRPVRSRSEEIEQGYELDKCEEYRLHAGTSRTRLVDGVTSDDYLCLGPSDSTGNRTLLFIEMDALKRKREYEPTACRLSPLNVGRNEPTKMNITIYDQPRSSKPNGWTTRETLKVQEQAGAAIEVKHVGKLSGTLSYSQTMYMPLETNYDQPVAKGKRFGRFLQTSRLASSTYGIASNFAFRNQTSQTLLSFGRYYQSRGCQGGNLLNLQGSVSAIPSVSRQTHNSCSPIKPRGGIQKATHGHVDASRSYDVVKESTSSSSVSSTRPTLGARDLEFDRQLKQLIQSIAGGRKTLTLPKCFDKLVSYALDSLVSGGPGFLCEHSHKVFFSRNFFIK